MEFPIVNATIKFSPVKKDKKATSNNRFVVKEVKCANQKPSTKPLVASKVVEVSVPREALNSRSQQTYALPSVPLIEVNINNHGFQVSMLFWVRSCWILSAGHTIRAIGRPLSWLLLKYCSNKLNCCGTHWIPCALNLTTMYTLRSHLLKPSRLSVKPVSNVHDVAIPWCSCNFSNWYLRETGASKLHQNWKAQHGSNYHEIEGMYNKEAASSQLRSPSV